MLSRSGSYSNLEPAHIICRFLQLVNRASDNLETNARVQECLITAQQAKKLVVRYIQVRLRNLPRVMSTDYLAAG